MWDTFCRTTCQDFDKADYIILNADYLEGDEVQ